MLAGRRCSRYWTSTARIAECLSLRGRQVHNRQGGGQDPGRPRSLTRGESAFIRSDNHPEIIAKALKRWLAACRGQIFYIELGPPWENAYSKTFIGRLGDELLRERVWQTQI